MFDQSPLKRLLVLLSAVAMGFALILCAVVLLSKRFAPADPSAAAVGQAVIQPVPALPVVAVTPAPPKRVDPVQVQFEQQVKPLLAKYCYSCHGNGKDKGDLAIDKYATILSIQRDHVTWQKVADNVATGAMPPKAKPQPTEAEKKLIGDWITSAFDWFDPSAPRDPGRVTVHRLNRNEYNNTVHDLLGVSFKPAGDFPADDTGYGFDNIGDVLSMSPMLAEKYIGAAEEIVDRSLAPPAPPEMKVVRYKGDDLQGGQANSDITTLASEGEVFRDDWPFPIAGDYEIRVKASADEAGPDPAKMSIRFDGRELKLVDVNDPPPKQKSTEFKVTVTVDKTGAHRVGAAFTNDYYNPDAPDAKNRGDRNLHVHSIAVAGPINAKPAEPSDTYKKVFFVAPGPGVTEEQAAFKILQRFCSRAYRRPATGKEVDQLLTLFKFARADNNDFAASVKVAITASLVSPNFLFRVEQERSTDPTKPYNISEYELATRLSYFLWSSMPDDELTAKAAADQLRRPEVLKQQVKRMLADPKAKALTSNFIGQWLELRNIEGHTIDKKLYPSFDDKLRADMRRETEMFFENIVSEDRSVLDLLDADYTFVNERLAKHYGMTGVTGNDFRKVPLDGTKRGGVLTMASVLTVTAMPTRTSPVKRGKFILEQILGAPPPPPPADVPPLADKPADASAKSLRERLQIHREDATCNSCHSRMDPLGFALENFDAIGRWRDKEGEFPIDATGVLPDGHAFKGPDDLVKIIASRKDEFTRTLTDKLMTYALGRGMESYDKRTIKDVSDAVAKDSYKFSTLVTQIVTSDAFEKRRAKRGDE